jgi:hypothetical protein
MAFESFAIIHKAQLIGWHGEIEQIRTEVVTLAGMTIGLLNHERQGE